MTDVAETKYGYDPYDYSSFPAEPEAVVPVVVSIPDSGISAVFEVVNGGIKIKWSNPEQGSYSLRLYNGGQTIYYGGHYSEYAPVFFDEFNLTGTETLTGYFVEYGDDLKWVADHPEFSIDLSTVSFPNLFDEANKISYTFSGFSSENEKLYGEFLKRLFPILLYYCGPPSESFNCVITNDGSGSFTTVDDGRTLLTDETYYPRLIAHEFVHIWKGRYTFTNDENWEYDDALSGFEEATAEGMAFEMMHEYVRCYPTDTATLDLLDYKPYQYWGSRTTFNDSIKYNRWTGAGDFWTHSGGQRSRYSIAATTFQTMMKSNPSAYKNIMQKYYEKIDADSSWRPNREDIVNIWADVVPEIDEIDTHLYLDKIPVFQGHKLDEGIYILNTIRPYGTSGDQQFTVSYVPLDGQVWWGIREDEIDNYNLPSWIDYVLGEDSYYYIDMQAQPFTIDVYNHLNTKMTTVHAVTAYERDEDGSPNGLGWVMIEDLELQNFPEGLYRETVTFDNFIAYDSGALEDFYFFGYQNFSQNKLDYVIMIGIPGVPSGSITITVEGADYTESIINGVAKFISNVWPLDMECQIPITVYNASNGTSHTYYRTVVEAGTIHSYHQYQFIIVDDDFNGVEDIYED